MVFLEAFSTSMRHFTALLLRSARGMAAPSILQCRYSAQPRCLSAKSLFQSPIQAPIAFHRTMMRQGIAFPPVNTPICTTEHFRSVHFLAASPSSRASGADGDIYELDKGIEVDVLIEGDPLSSQRCVPQLVFNLPADCSTSFEKQRIAAQPCLLGE